MRTISLAAALLLSAAIPAYPCDTTWNYTDATHAVVACTNSNGRGESGLVTNPAVQAWVAQGNTIGPAPAAPITSIQITSTSVPALNATYPIDPGSMAIMHKIAVYILINGHFPNGAALQQWKDTSGVVHSFPSTQWQALVTAATDATLKIQQGQTPTQPVAIP